MQPQYSQLSDSKKEVLNLYKANCDFAGEQFFADYLNQSLRERRHLPVEWEEKTLELDAVIGKSSLDHASRFYRATVDKFVAPYISEGYLIYPAYMSTAVDENIIQRHWSGNWKNIPAALLCIECSAGTSALNLELNPSFGGHEQEILLPRNSKFIVKKVEEVTDRNAMNKRMSEFYAKNYSSLIIYELEYL